MKILALDTSTEACSVALYNDGYIVEDYCIAPQQHSKIILTMIEKILANHALTVNQLDALAFGKGPGSFTGVRIAASVIQGIAYAIDLPVVPVSTLQAIAQGVKREHKASKVLSAIDARMNEVYWGAYQQINDFMQLIAPEKVCKPDAINVEMQDDWIGAGSGWIAYQPLLMQQVSVSAVYEYYPHAYDIAHLASDAYQKKEFVSAEYAIPTYLRDNVAQPKSV